MLAHYESLKVSWENSNILLIDHVSSTTFFVFFLRKGSNVLLRLIV